MRVLLVYSNEFSNVLPPPPIGLSYVAQAAREAGHEVQLVDRLISGRDEQTLSRAAESFRPDVIGVSVRNIDNVIHQRLASHLGRLRKDLTALRAATSAPIVLGGPAISVLGKKALEILKADYAVLGEGEIAFPALLEELEKDGKPAAVPGVCSHASVGRTINSTPGRMLRHFGPSGLQHWVDWRAYERQGATWPIQTKRGCAFSCTYCTYPTVEGHAMRLRDPEAVVDEMEEVSRTVGPRCFEIVDSTFNVPEAHAIRLCEAIIRRGLKVNLTTMGVNPRSTSPELFDLMKRAGFNSMMVTPEAGDDRMLASLQKGFDETAVRKCAREVREAGIPSMWFFMLGGPGESRETVDRTMTLVEEELNWRGCLTLITTGIRVLPGTALANQAVQDGTLAPDTDLSKPAFYFSGRVDEQWMLRRINESIARHPTILHAAEDGTRSRKGRFVTRMMHAIGLAPPYWRFLPRLLSMGFVHRQRLKEAELLAVDSAPDCQRQPF